MRGSRCGLRVPLLPLRPRSLAGPPWGSTSGRTRYDARMGKEFSLCVLAWALSGCESGGGNSGPCGTAPYGACNVQTPAQMRPFDEARGCLGAPVAVPGLCMSSVLGDHCFRSASIGPDCAVSPDGRLFLTAVTGDEYVFGAGWQSTAYPMWYGPARPSGDVAFDSRCAVAECAPSCDGTPTGLFAGRCTDGGTDAGVGDGGDRGGGGLPNCMGVCCTNPTAGSACAAADEGTSCHGSTLCPGGLILSQTLQCTVGAWTAQSGVCSADGGLADNGCPGSQPANGTACSLADGGACQYALVCSGTCDAGAPSAGGDGGASAGTGCGPVAGRVGPAICRSGQWQTTPLGACP
jgi:hypothetical protein